MRGADHLGLGVGKQHRRAIGRHHAQRDAGTVGHQRVGPGRARRGPAVGADNQHVGRMELVHGQEIGLAQREMGGGAAAVLAHIVGLIARAVAAVERGVEAFAHAALAREEAMLHAVEVGKGARLDHVLVRGGVRKTGRRGASVVAHGQNAEEGAHLVGRDQASRRRIDRRALGLAGAGLQGAGALGDAEPPQKVALTHRAEGRPAGRSA